jgi:RNA polymerase sigma-70 factor (ECF subfamily)
VLETVDIRPDLDPSAFFDEAYPQVFRFVAAFTGAPAADVDDLVQEALLEAWRGRASFRGDASRLTWVLGIARRLATGRRRSTARREEILRALRALEEAPVPADVLRDEETVRRVREALDALDPAHAEALILRYYDGRPVREIAAALGESEKAVESRLHRAREALRDRLKEESP